MKKCAYTTFLIALIILFTTPIAFGQALDGLWFKAKTTFKGYTVDGSGLISKANVTMVNYFYLTWIDTAYYVATYDEAGNVMPVGDSSFHTIGANEDIVRDFTMELGHVSNSINMVQSSIIKIKRDSHGAVKSATFNSMGCDIWRAQIEGNGFYGGCAMKAKTIEYPPFNT